jgi:tRNA(fMet)-specific endonuclease VapC
MIILDTDHVTLLRYPENPGHDALRTRMQAATDQSFAVTIVTIEEQMRGWLSYIARFRDVHRQIPAYERLGKMIEFYTEWPTIPFDPAAADEFVRLTKLRIRIASSDLKIASIALVHDALLLTANVRDFRRVPGLKMENWLPQ